MSGHFLGVPLLFIGMVLIVNAAWLKNRVETRDVGVFNLLVGVLGAIAALYFAWRHNDLPLSAGFMLFAMTYIWIGINAIRGANDQRALGMYCLLVALITIPYAVKAYRGGDLGWAFEWVTFGSLWFLFYQMLARGNSKIVGITAMLTYFVGFEALVTGWIYIYGYWPFGDWWPINVLAAN